MNLLSNTLLATTSLTMNGGLEPVCPGDAKSFTIEAVTDAQSYTWSMPAGTATINGSPDSYTGPELTVTIAFENGFAATSSSKLSVTANNDCGEGKVKNLTIYRNTIGPISVIDGDANSNCSNTKQYSVTQAAGNATSFEWSWSVAPTPVNSATITQVSPGDAFVSIQFGEFTSGTLQVRAVNGCGGTLHKSKLLKGAPAVPGVPTGPMTVCNDGVTEYEYTSTGSPGATSYEWLQPNGATKVGGSQVDNLPGGSSTIRYTFGPTYSGAAIRVTAYNDCGSAYKGLTGIAVSCPPPRLSDKDNAMKFNGVELYPNPATDLATVRFNSEASANYSLVLRDITGREIMVKEGAAVQGINFIELNLSDLPKGVYMVSLATGDQRNTLRLVTE
jgi:hypothetical protein